MCATLALLIRPQSVMELAAAGCAHLSDIMTAAVKEHVQQQLITRGPTIQH